MDFYVPYINRRASEAQAVWFGRIMGAVIMTMGIFWAAILLQQSDRPIFLYLLSAYGYVTPGIATMFLLGILWKQPLAPALTAGILTIPLSIAFEKLVPVLAPAAWVPYLTPFWNRTGIVFWICMLAGIIISLLTKPKPEAELKGLIWNKESLRMPDELRHVGWLKSPFLWWAIITAIIVGCYVKYWSRAVHGRDSIFRSTAGRMPPLR